jgi:hypothetical protein
MFLVLRRTLKTEEGKKKEKNVRIQALALSSGGQYEALR